MSIVPISTRSTTAIMLRCLLLLLIALPVFAQEPEPITLDDPRTVTLSGTGASEFVYSGTAGEVVTITVRTRHELAEDEEAYVRDTVVEVLDPMGERIAYNDDHRTQRDDLLATDSVITHLILPQTGEYVIRANTYGGVFATAVEVSVTAGDIFDSVIEANDDGLVIMATLPPYMGYQYTFPAAAGAVLTFTAHDLSGRLDPLLALLDANGERIALNDDHGTNDLALDVLDAKLTGFTIPADGDYTLRVTDFLGRGGRVEITIAGLD